MIGIENCIKALVFGQKEKALGWARSFFLTLIEDFSSTKVRPAGSMFIVVTRLTAGRRFDRESVTRFSQGFHSILDGVTNTESPGDECFFAQRFKGRDQLTCRLIDELVMF